MAFLDVGTVPRDHWLKTNLTIATEYGYYAVFGKTKYRALNEFQKLLRAATFGNIGHETTPGSLVRNDYFQKSGGFIEGIRAGDDQEWRMQIRDVSKKYFTPTETTLDYSILPNNLLDMQKKYFIYYLHSAKVRAQKKIRDLYLSVFLIFLMIIVTKWNYIIGGWDTNPLFIPNIQKIFTLSMVLILLIFIIFDGLFTQRGSLNLLNWTAKVLLFFLISLSVYRWNTEVIDWVEDSIFFIPHITKIYIVMLLLCSFFYRGIFTPLRLGIAPSFIFPINWIKVGLIGLSFDLLKTPGIMLGIILAPFQKKLSKL